MNEEKIIIYDLSLSHENIFISGKKKYAVNIRNIKITNKKRLIIDWVFFIRDEHTIMTGKTAMRV